MTDFSTVEVEPERIRVRTGVRSRLLFDPVRVVHEERTERGWEFVLRSPSNAAQILVAVDDDDSVRTLRGLPRDLIDHEQLAALRRRIALAALPLDPLFDRFSDQQRLRQRQLDAWRRSVRTNAIAVLVFLSIVLVVSELAR